MTALTLAPTTTDQEEPSTMTTRYRLPRNFYLDHVARDLPAGELIHRTGSVVVVDLTPAELAELRSDAYHYAHDEELRSYDRSLAGSAARTVAAIDRQTPADEPAASTEQAFVTYRRHGGPDGIDATDLLAAILDGDVASGDRVAVIVRRPGADSSAYYFGSVVWTSATAEELTVVDVSEPNVRRNLDIFDVAVLHRFVRPEEAATR